MMLTRTPAQNHNYNLKLTRAELLAIHETRNLYDRSSDRFRVWNDITAIVEREAERLGRRP